MLMTMMSIIWANFVFLVSVTHLPKNNLFIASHTCATLTSNIHSQTTNVDLAAFVTHKLEEIFPRILVVQIIDTVV
jgi:hypothetical protein